MRYNAATGMFELEEGDEEAQFASVPSGDFSKYRMSTFPVTDIFNRTKENNEPIFSNPGEAEIEPTAAGDYGSIDYGDDGFNIMQYLPFGDKSITGSIMRGIGSLVPERDPRQTALDNFYGNVSNGTIQSGLMAGYNPVSGGLLNTLTGGMFGQPTNYGLQRAYQKRIDTIKKTLTRKDSKVLEDRLAQLQEDKRREAMALEQPTIDRAREANPDVYGNAANVPGALGPGGGFSTTGREGAFDSKSGRGRQDFYMGGLASIL